MSESGISVILRAGNNREAALKALQQLARLKNKVAIEVLVLFNAPQEKHLHIANEFAAEVPITVFSANNRTFKGFDKRLRYDTALILATPLDTDSGSILEEFIAFNKKAKPFIKPHNKSPTKTLFLKREALQRLSEQKLTSGQPELINALEGIESDKEKSRKEQKSLDKKIASKEQDIIWLDNELTEQYSEIEQLDKKYDSLDEKSDEAKALKAELKGRVYKANDTLKELKEKHDEMERMRIRRYSILA